MLETEAMTIPAMLALAGRTINEAELTEEAA